VITFAVGLEVRESVDALEAAAVEHDRDHALRQDAELQRVAELAEDSPSETVLSAFSLVEQDLHESWWGDWPDPLRSVRRL
jgi:hypothetical protein